MEFAFFPTAAEAPPGQLMTPDKVLVGESYPGNDPKTKSQGTRVSAGAIVDE